MAMREYRKGNWTVEETMILIEAKKKDDERRKLNRSKQITVITTSPSSSGSGNSSKPVAELRWKWVEEYCWGKGCFRSQNQCNDKWDNLMRDYKKVRDYQKTLNPNFNNNTSQQPTTSNIKSYWSMDKIERKEKGLPTNMLPQIYQALFDVVETTATTTTVTTSFLPPSPLPVRPALQISPPPSSLPIPPPSQPQRSPALGNLCLFCKML
ncbi:Trihelix transcription factor ASR3 [Bienertia sinuspersici]